MAESPPELQLEIEKLERKHAENPEGRYFVPLANAYRKLGDHDHAEQLLREGLRRHPEYLSAHIVLGRCLADRGATAQAAEEFRYVLSLDPQNLIALRTLGELTLAEGERAEAARWYQELLAVDPMNEEARRVLDSLDVPAEPTPFEEEFRAGRGWWERAEEAEEDEPAPAEAAGSEAAPDWERAAEPEPERPREPELVLEEEPAFAAPEEAEVVVTETIAELYARQGLYEQAADVYRELLRRRGEDPALRRRLDEVLGLAAAEAAPARGPEPDAFADTFAEGFGWGEAEPALLPEPGATAEYADVADPRDDLSFHLEPALEPDLELAPPLAAAPEVEAEAEGPTVAAYFAELLAWRPGAGAPEAEVEPVVEPEAEWVAEAEAAVPPDAPAPLVAEPAGGTGRADDDLFPWELPRHDARAEAETSEEVDFSFDDILIEDEPAETLAPEPPAPAPPAAESTEDDDLESFQAWLRSLKR